MFSDDELKQSGFSDKKRFFFSNDLNDDLLDSINQLGVDELRFLLDKIKSGSLLSLVSDRLQKLENPNLVCPVCNASVSEDDSFVLYFGPKELRRKARFCGLDCLEFFINNNLKK